MTVDVASGARLVEVTAPGGSTVEVVEGASSSVEILSQAGTTVEVLPAPTLTVEVVDLAGTQVEVLTPEAPPTTVEVGVVGTRGPKGDPGDAASGAYLHVQEAPSTIWDVDHKLGYDPAAFRVEAVNGDHWYPLNVEYTTPGVVARLSFPESIAGTARTS